MSPAQHMKRTELERDVLKAKNLLAAARVEYEMALDTLAEGADAQPPRISRNMLALELTVSQLVALECRHAVAVERLQVFNREVMS